MPPERDIEKLLQAAAARRRREAGAPFDLHPATRRLLQGEVARQYRTPPRARLAWLPFLARHRFPIAFAAGLSVVLGLGVWLFQPRTGRNPRAGTVALNETAKRALDLGALAPAVAKVQKGPAAPSPGAPATVAQVVAPAKPAAADVRSRLVSRGEAKDVSAARAEPERQALVDAVTVASAVAPTATPSASPVPGADGREIASAKAEAFGSPYRWALPSERAPASEVPALKTGALAAGDASRSFTAPSASAVGGLTVDRWGGNAPLVPPAAPVTALNGASAAPAGAVELSYGEFVRAPATELRLTRRFAPLAERAGAGTAAATAPPAVLEHFRVERVGERLEIIDRDGSTYAGRVGPASAPSVALADEAFARDKVDGAQRRGTLNRGGAGVGAPLAAGSRTSAAADVKASELGQSVFSFHAVGTNRTLNQQVVFDGDLFILTNAPAPPALTPAAQAVAAAPAFREAAPGQTARPTSQLQSLRLRGQAVIGGQRKVEINAVPVTR